VTWFKDSIYFKAEFDWFLSSPYLDDWREKKNLFAIHLPLLFHWVNLGSSDHINFFPAAPESNLYVPKQNQAFLKKQSTIKHWFEFHGWFSWIGFHQTFKWSPITIIQDFPPTPLLPQRRWFTTYWLLYEQICLLLLLQVYNVNSFYGSEAEFPVDINIDMAKVMGVFLAQLRYVLTNAMAALPFHVRAGWLFL